MNKNRILEIYAQYCWPLVRRFARIPKRCKNCILSQQYAPLVDGLCPECRGGGSTVSYAAPAETSPETKNSFDQVIRSHVGNRRFDALLLLSGGKDSAYESRPLDAIVRDCWHWLKKEKLL